MICTFKFINNKSCCQISRNKTCQNKHRPRTRLPTYMSRFLCASLSHTHTNTLTTVWSNLNLHPEKPLPRWQTNLKPHPEALSFSSHHPSTNKHLTAPLTNSKPPPLHHCCDWLFAAVNPRGENSFGLRLWALWLQVQRLASG